MDSAKKSATPTIIVVVARASRTNVWFYEYSSLPKPAINFLFTNVSWLLDAREDAMKNIPSYILLFAKKGLSNDDFGVARVTVFQEIRPGSGFKTDDCVKQQSRGATAERLEGANR